MAAKARPTDGTPSTVMPAGASGRLPDLSDNGTRQTPAWDPAKLPRKARVPAIIAAASLPINRLILEELRTWYDWIPQLLKAGGLAISLAGDLSQLTWQAAAPEPEMTQALRAYLVEYPIPDESFVDLDRVLARCASFDADDLAQPAPLIDLFQTGHDRLYSRLFQS